MGVARDFDLFDYLIFGATLLISAVVGLYYAFKKGGQKTTKAFLLGDRKMPIIPSALSLLVSFQSGILILGISSEMYVRGVTYAWYIMGIAIGLPLAAFVYQPVFYNLKLVSAYEYLELRFNSRFVRLIGSTLFIVVTLLYMSIVMYAPSVALSSVTGFNLELLIALSGVVCTVYTALGGLKAVVWTDAFQAVVMYVGFLAIIIQGTIDIGGWKKLWSVSIARGRLNTNSLLLVLPGILTMVPLVCLCGLVMYVYYSDCDPLRLGFVNNRDELLPYFTMEVLSNIKGLPGLFVSCIFSGTMSTVSSGLNSLAAVVWEDFLKPTYGNRWTDQKATKANKLIACAFGVISIGLACLAKYLGGVFMAANTVLSAVGGPLSGLFLFGMLFPWGNKKGAIAGVAVAISVVTWICIGAQVYKPWTGALSQSISGCDSMVLRAANFWAYNDSLTNETLWMWNNRTVKLTEMISTDDVHLTGFTSIYKMSFVLYGLLAIILVFLVGIPVSLITADTLDLANLDSRLIFQGYYYVCRCMPKSQRKYLKPKFDFDLPIAKQQFVAIPIDDKEYSHEKSNSYTEESETGVLFIEKNKNIIE